MCPTELRNLVFSLEYLVYNERRVLLGGIRLGGSATPTGLTPNPLVTAAHMTDGEAPHQDVGEILVDDAGAGSKIN